MAGQSNITNARVADLEKRFLAAWSEQDRAETAGADTAFESAFHRTQALAEEIGRLPGDTLEELRLMAKAVSWAHAGSFEPGGDIDQRIIGAMLAGLGVDVARERRAAA